MGWGQGNLGGGAILNFKVVRYANENVLPETAKENTIAVFTEIDIKNSVFSSTEPKEPENGIVWFKTGSSSPVAFNALKKGTVMVYPVTAKQYVNGSWVDVMAKSYIDGNWVDWFVYLFTEGEGQNVPWVFSTYNEKGTVVEENGTIVFSYSTVDNAYTAAGTEYAVDLSGFTKLFFDLQVSTMYGSVEGPIAVGITSAQVVAGYQKNTFIASASSEADNVRRTVEVDISNLDSGYVSIHGLMKAVVYNVWME